MTPPVVQATPHAAARARRQATAVAAVGAAVPTVLAAQGMTSLAADVLGFPVLVAIALASFLELALVSSALLARAAALAGRPGGADAVAVWVVSATSGLLAGVHELVSGTAGGGSTWEVDPGTFLAAAVRAVAPLVAAWLWERVLQAARAEQAERTLAEVRRDRRLLDVARAALAVRRLDTLDGGRSATRRGRRARRRLDRAHLSVLRVQPPGATLASVLAAVGQVDHLPAATTVEPLVARTDVSDGVMPGTRCGVAHSVHGRPLVVGLAEGDRTASVNATVTGDDTGSRRQDAWATTTRQGSDARFASVMQEPATPDGLPLAIDVALDLVRHDRTVSGARVASEVSRRGRPVSIRTGQRLRNRAAAMLEPEPVG